MVPVWLRVEAGERRERDQAQGHRNEMACWHGYKKDLV